MEVSSFIASCVKKSVGFDVSKTKNASEAIGKAEYLLIEILAKEKQGVKVMSSTFRDLILTWHQEALKRLQRGEIRTPRNVQSQYVKLQKHLDAHWGLTSPLSSLTQENFDAYLEYCSNTGVKLSTVVDEMKFISTLVNNFGMKIGAPLVPQVDIRILKDHASKRFDTFNKDEWRRVRNALEAYIKPDDGRLFLRDFQLGNTVKRAKPCFINQYVEEERRKQLRWLVLILEASDCRPHEIVGTVASSLRWGDVRIDSMQMDSGKFAMLAHLNIRTMTKAGRRVVPTYVGWIFGAIKGETNFSGDEDFVFCQQTGKNAGKPTELDTLRRMFHRFVIARAEVTRFKASFYSIRHMWVTNCLRDGVPIALVAEAAGNSVAEIEKTHSKLVMDSPAITKQFWDRTKPLQKPPKQEILLSIDAG